ncbi:hypothetical protein Barb7_03153 [Bacteroidales bacterium Barb7]|nr:hypothetical protein Barb7_03153 [Bacteroidales bacterium Barb7]
MVHVRKRIDAGKGVVIHLSVDAVHHARRSRRGGYLAGVQYIQG